MSAAGLLHIALSSVSHQQTKLHIIMQWLDSEITVCYTESVQYDIRLDIAILQLDVINTIISANISKNSCCHLIF